MKVDIRPAVFITGADSPTGLTTARALNGMPLDIVGVAQNLSAPTCQSKIWDKILFIPGDASQQIDELLLLGRERNRPTETVMLFSQDSLVIEASNRIDELREYFQVPIPEADIVNVLMDKTEFHHWATRHGFSIPFSLIAESENDVLEVAKEFEYPCILKPLVRTPKWDECYPNQKFYSIESYQELLKVFHSEDPFSVCERYLLQQWIPGSDDNVLFVLFVVATNGKILKRVGGQKIWQWPPLGGSTALCRTCNDPKMLEEAEAVIKQSGVIGLASVEFKRHPVSKTLFITEPTVGRNDYQSGLACGTDRNPTRLLVESILGGPQLNSNGSTASVERNEDYTAIWIDEISCLRRIRYLGVIRSILQLLKVLKVGPKFRFLWWQPSDWQPLKQSFSSLTWSRRRNKPINISFGLEE